ncbi:MAG TPA: class I SAM-dependent methyltransferase [Anaerolineae bacterium]|nr:class I SAM-dependent methyltransferase [Anaerolineae bacterium]
MKPGSDLKVEARKHFQYLHLIHEDVREELYLLGFSEQPARICDFGCGNGLTTYSLALEFEQAECTGIDRFDGVDAPRLEHLLQFQESLTKHCAEEAASRKPFPEELCSLVQKARLPRFHRGDFIRGENLPEGVDLAYCKRIFANVFEGKQAGDPSGGEGLHLAVDRIAASIRPQGTLCSVEFEGFDLAKYLAKRNLRVLKRATLQRRDVRSRGRTTVLSRYALVLCQKL